MICLGCKIEVIAIRGGIGCLAAGDIPNLLYRLSLFVLRACGYPPGIHFYFKGSLRVSASYLFYLAFSFCFYCFVLFCFVLFRFVVFFLMFLCSGWSFVGVPLVFPFPANHVLPDWQPRIILGMIETRSVSVENTRTQHTLHTHTLQQP